MGAHYYPPEDHRLTVCVRCLKAQDNPLTHTPCCAAPERYVYRLEGPARADAPRKRSLRGRQLVLEVCAECGHLRGAEEIVYRGADTGPVCGVCWGEGARPSERPGAVLDEKGGRVGG